MSDVNTDVCVERAVLRQAAYAVCMQVWRGGEGVRAPCDGGDVTCHGTYTRVPMHTFCPPSHPLNHVCPSSQLSHTLPTPLKQMSGSSMYMGLPGPFPQGPSLWQISYQSVV